MFRTDGALSEWEDKLTTAADTYGALAVAWILHAATAALRKNEFFHFRKNASHPLTDLCRQGVTG